MLEGLWTVEFITNFGYVGSGVVVFVSNRILGGDSQYYYEGKVRVEGETLSTELKVTHFSGETSSVFGNLKNFSINLSGKVQQGPDMNFSGYLVENPNMKITIKGQKRQGI